MKSKAKFLSIVFLAFLLLLPASMADGGIYIPPTDYDEHVYLPSQKAAIFWDGNTEILTLSTKIQAGDSMNMVWVIPLPSSTDPEVEEGDMEIFYDLAELFRPQHDAVRGIGFGMTATEGAPPTVEIIEAKTVDIYSIVVLKATDASDMIDWLNTHGFSVPQSSVPILQEYCDQGNFYFIANQINLGAKFTTQPTAEDKECAELVYDYVEDEYNYYYGSGDIDYLVEQGMEYYEEECYYSSPSVTQTLVEMKRGIATPLKITFEPEEPFYPMRISSINEGETEIHVYVFSESGVTDSSGTLSVEQMTTVPSYMKDDYGLTNQNYVTYLKYDGYLSNLDEDSVFRTSGYRGDLDPSPEPVVPEEYSGYIMIVILALGLLGLILFVVFLLSLGEKDKKGMWTAASKSMCAGLVIILVAFIVCIALLFWSLFQL